MAPVKPMGAKAADTPKTKPGVTGFPQDYNETPPPAQDLNPDAVTEDSVLPEATAGSDVETPARGARKAKSGARRSAGKKSRSRA